MTAFQQFVMRIRPWMLALIGALMAVTVAGLVFAGALGISRREQLVEMLIGQLIAGVCFAVFPLLIKAKTPSE
ncbi:MAG TPA: hypothetical protein VEB22_08540 [Phycisphaerales bacterium]|nr:hypothetical protein [Phycisphaerales bacterium]